MGRRIPHLQDVEWVSGHLLSPPPLIKECVLNDFLIWKALLKPRRLVLIAGPCVIENEGLCIKVASALKKTCAKLGINYIFKASFDKANRTSGQSFRGPGMKSGLEILGKIREDRLSLPIVTDVHSEQQSRGSSRRWSDMLQIPAFLCRQTDLIEACGRHR